MDNSRRIFDNERYVGYWFTLNPQTMSYHHKVEDVEVSREKMDNLIHTEDLQGLLNKLGINHVDAVKKISSL